MNAQKGNLFIANVFFEDWTVSIFKKKTRKSQLISTFQLLINMIKIYSSESFYLRVSFYHLCRDELVDLLLRLPGVVVDVLISTYSWTSQHFLHNQSINQPVEKNQYRSIYRMAISRNMKEFPETSSKHKIIKNS